MEVHLEAIDRGQFYPTKFVIFALRSPEAGERGYVRIMA